MRRAALRWALAVSILLGAASCGPNASQIGRDSKLLFIGLDGAEWSLIRKLVAEGRMPNVKALMDRGLYGDLLSLDPPQKSPAIWTSIATGKTPDVHGIHGFIEERNGRPLTQNARRVRALWNILSASGRKVGLVGWLMSWPAEEVNGYVVSDYLQYAASEGRRLSKRTFPESLYAEVAPLNRAWPRMPWSAVNEFLGQPVDSTLVGGTNPDTLAIARARPIRWMISADASFADMALKLGRERPAEFTAVYLRSTDLFGHLYWNFMHPEAWPKSLVDPDMVPYFAASVPKNYEWIDRQIGRLLTLADARTTVLICSDHGFKGGEGGIADHRPEGILIMAGPHIGRGELTGATVLDIAPTVLALFGLPKADDMPGKVLWSAFDSSIRASMFKKTLPTYETGAARPPGDALATPVDEELRERLRTLGYLK